jgi:flagellar protein FliO/FliZ
MKRFLLAGGVAATTFIWQVEAALAVSESEKKQPLNLPLDQAQQQAGGGGNGSSASGGLMRTFFGLIVVVAVIYALYWILKQVKKSREEQASGSGLHSLASLPLGANRSLHMIRAGREIVLVGVAEHGVAPIRSYTEEEAYEAGLIAHPDDDGGSGDGDGGGGTRPAKPGFATSAQAITGALSRLRERTVRK